jgi:tetratricopeptide (TPR) repeat protein
MCSGKNLDAENCRVLGMFSAVLVFLLSGCAAQLPSRDVHPVPDRVFLQNVPFHPQKRYQCGPAALAMLLEWNGVEVSLPQLNEEVYSPALKGSLQPAVIASARRNGFVAYPIRGMTALMTELNAGHPVMVLQNLGFSWIPRWHYAVVIGYDRGFDKVALHTGTDAASWLSATAFSNTWGRSQHWGLLVLPPGVLPATATEQEYVSAVIGLERAGRHEAAVRSYREALQRWPDSFVAWMGYGNSLHALGQLGEAEAALRKAAALNPGSGLAMNNLAVVLSEAGQKNEALEVIEQAIQRGGDSIDLFLQTREEILAR